MRDFGINIMASFAFFVAGLFAATIKNWFHLAPLRKLWLPLAMNSPISVVLSTRQGPDVSSTPRVSLREMKAYLRINNILTSLKIPVDSVDSESDLNTLADKTLVLLGGPTANKITAIIWSKIATSQPFMLDDATHTISSGTRKYEPKKDKDGYWIEDYGLVMRTKDPRRAEHRLMIIMGCHGFGTFAAASMLTDRAFAKEIVKKTTNGDFVAIVHVKLNKGNILESRLEECYVYPR